MTHSLDDPTPGCASPDVGQASETFKRQLLLVFMIAIFPRFQRSLIYRPTRAKLSPADAMLGPGSIHDISVRTQDGLNLQGWHILAKGRIARDEAACNRELAMGRPLVLYFPGNGGHRLFRRDEFELLASLGADVFAFDYRGYADNPGRPSEEQIARDVESVWNYATKTRGVPADRIVLYGESLGGAIATRLAAHCCQTSQRPRGLVVRSTFSTLADVGAYWFPYIPARWLVLEKYLSVQRMAEVTCPLLQLHGARDTVIPPKLGAALFAQAPEKSLTGISKQFVTLPYATHNDVVFPNRQQLYDVLRDFFERIAPVHEIQIPRPHLRSINSNARI